MIDSGNDTNTLAAPRGNAWRRVAALVLVVAALGLPVNHVPTYALLVVAAAVVFCGQVTLRARAWAIAAGAVVAAAAAATLIAPAPIAEGENVFLGGPRGDVLARDLPADVYKFMAAKFDAVYPPAVQCKDTPGCWKDMRGPDRLYAFSADGIFDSAGASRGVTGIDFSEPLWLRLGFTNDVRYNWGTDAPDVHRGDRDRRFWAGLWRWHTAMPYFVMYRFPPDYVGSRLCWSGDVLWEGPDGRYQALSHAGMDCRVITGGDVGRQIFGVGIDTKALAMTLHAPAGVTARLVIGAVLRAIAVLAVLILLVRVRWRAVAPVFALAVLAVAVIAIDDASFLGGWRPMDGGDDGLFYTGVGREILEQLLAGHIGEALRGGEGVFYYGGPALRYLRALEMVVFGDTNLGYLSIVLLLPVIVWHLFRRFLDEPFAWRLALVFTALPLGDIFGTSFFHYAKWAGRGFADPMAHICLIWGVLVIVGGRDESGSRAGAALAASALMALAVCTKPLVAPMAGVVLCSAGLVALYRRQWPRVVALCIGFSPVLLMPLHNWYFGHQLVLLSTNADLPSLLVMPPAAWAAALRDLVTLHWGGPELHRAIVHLGDLLRGPNESTALVIPINAAAAATVVWVALRGREFDPWLRIVAAAVIAEYGAALFYAATARYFFSMWFLTLLVVLVVIAQKLPTFLERHGYKRARQA
ncbi:MAG: hypothetical protein ACTHLO_15625, partial [Pseudolabrys sp.]